MVASAVPARALAQASNLVTVRLGATTSDDMTPVIYAQKSGIFAKYGLAAELVPMTSGAASAAGLVSGTFDFGKSSTPNLLDAHAKGLGLTLVTAALVGSSREMSTAFLVRKDAPIQGGRDFENQLVSVAALGDIGYLGLHVWVDRHGGDPKNVKFLEIPLSAAAPALDTGRVAAAESSVPALQVALETGRFRAIYVLGLLGRSYLISAWATTKEFSAKHPATVRAFARAYGEAAAYTNAHHRETSAMMASYTGIAEDLIARMPRATAGSTIAAGQLQPIIDAEVKYGLLKARFPAVEMIDPNVG